MVGRGTPNQFHKGYHSTHFRDGETLNWQVLLKDLHADLGFDVSRKLKRIRGHVDLNEMDCCYVGSFLCDIYNGW